MRPQGAEEGDLNRLFQKLQIEQIAYYHVTHGHRGHYVSSPVFLRIVIATVDVDQDTIWPRAITCDGEHLSVWPEIDGDGGCSWGWYDWNKVMRGIALSK